MLFPKSMKLKPMTPIIPATFNSLSLPNLSARTPAGKTKTVNAIPLAAEVQPNKVFDFPEKKKMYAEKTFPIQIPLPND